MNFPHRLAPTDRTQDSIDLMADRALSVLTMLLIQFTEECSRLSDASIVGALDVVINEIEDIKMLNLAHECKPESSHEEKQDY